MTVPYEFLQHDRGSDRENDRGSYRVVERSAELTAPEGGPHLRSVDDVPVVASEPTLAPSPELLSPELPTREPPLSLPAQIREDFAAHGRDLLSPGFHALAVHRFGVWRMGIDRRLFRAPMTLIYRTLHRAATGIYGIELPYTARVGRRVVIEHQHGIVVHGKTVIGDDCILRQGVTLGIRSMDRLDDAPVLGNGVNVGAGAKIIGRVHVGDRAQIGANAVVLHDVPAGALAVGVPAALVPRRPRY